MKVNERYKEIQGKTDKLIQLREIAKKALDSIQIAPAYCEGVSCLDCPCNIGVHEIICISCAQVIR